MAVQLDAMTLNNNYYRQVLNTTKNQQLVVMSIQDCIPKEIHPDNDQFIKIVQGNARVTINNFSYDLNEGDSVTIPAGSYHEVLNIGDIELKIYTVYSPPHHAPNTIHKTRADDV